MPVLRTLIHSSERRSQSSYTRSGLGSPPASLGEGTSNLRGPGVTGTALGVTPSPLRLPLVAVAQSSPNPFLISPMATPTTGMTGFLKYPPQWTVPYDGTTPTPPPRRLPLRRQGAVELLAVQTPRIDKNRLLRRRGAMLNVLQSPSMSTPVVSAAPANQQPQAAQDASVDITIKEEPQTPSMFNHFNASQCHITKTLITEVPEKSADPLSMTTGRAFKPLSLNGMLFLHQ
jgi:hypothetical protein